VIAQIMARAKFHCGICDGWATPVEAELHFHEHRPLRGEGGYDGGIFLISIGFEPYPECEFPLWRSSEDWDPPRGYSMRTRGSG
jgi:hypothetical protein